MPAALPQPAPHSVPPTMTTREYWNGRSPEFADVHPRLRLIGRLVAALSDVRDVLDVGCGPAVMRTVLPPQLEYFGVDIAPSVIEALGDPAHFAVADLDASPRPFGERRFDLLLCSGVFEYVNDVRGFMAMLDAKAVPGGHLILSFTNHQHRKDGMRWVRGTYRGYRDPHVNFMLVPEVRQLLRASGWLITQTRAITAAGDEHPVFRRFLRFPLNVVNRQYIFVCRRARGALA